jgi:hypothetical protein
VRLGLLCVAALLIVAVTPIAGILAGVVGAAVGAGLAIYALKLTRIEHTAEGTFYTGNVYIGLGVTALLIARVGYRLIGATAAIQDAVAHAGAGTAAPPPQAVASTFSSPLTVAVLFVMVGYYIAYYAGILRKARAAR